MQAKRKKVAKKKNVGGRPALSEEERRDRTIDFVRFSAAEIDRLRERYYRETEGQDVTFSEWFRLLVLG